MDGKLDKDFETIRALVRRSANELIRVPGAAVPGVLAPAIFFLGLTSVFGSLTLLPGFTTDSYASFMIPVSMLQGAGFTGAAMGVNLARDIELGLFDRFLASPAPRWVLLTGLVLSAAIRSVRWCTCRWSSSSRSTTRLSEGSCLRTIGKTAASSMVWWRWTKRQ